MGGHKKGGENKRVVKKNTLRIQQVKKKVVQYKGTQRDKAEEGGQPPKMMCGKGDLDCATKVLNLGP